MIFDLEVSKVFDNGSITPCLARSEQVYEPHVSFILASSYFLDGILKKLSFDRLSFFVVAAWLFFSARLIFIDNDMAHFSDYKPLTWRQHSHSGKHGCSYLLKELLQVKLFV